MQVYACGVHATNPTVGLHLQETLGQVFGQFARLIGRRQALDPHAMSRTDYALLTTLEHCDHEAGLRTSHLATALGQDASPSAGASPSSRPTATSSGSPTRATVAPRPSA